jgi:hypothetical protein
MGEVSVNDLLPEEGDALLRRLVQLAVFGGRIDSNPHGGADVLTIENATIGLTPSESATLFELGVKRDGQRR